MKNSEFRERTKKKEIYEIKSQWRWGLFSFFKTLDKLT